jgi:hypothetical protein
MNQPPIVTGWKPTQADTDLTRKHEEALAWLATLTPFHRRCYLHELGQPVRLYKYRSIPHHKNARIQRKLRHPLVQLLLNNELWMAPTVSFNDPFDGRAGYDIVERGDELRQIMNAHARRLAAEHGLSTDVRVDEEVVQHPERLVRVLEADHERMRNILGICALTTDAHNPLMWSHYADEHRGICIQLDASCDLRNLFPQPVEYSNTYPVMADIFRPRAERADVLPFLRKSEHWSYEKEWRLVDPHHVRAPRPFSPRALTAVIFGLRTSQQDKDYVLRLLDEREKKYKVRPAVYDAVEAKRRYRVRFRRLRFPL